MKFSSSAPFRLPGITSRFTKGRSAEAKLVRIERPKRGCQFSNPTDQKVGQTRQDSSEIIADRDLQATAGFDDGEDGCDARSGFLATMCRYNVDPGKSPVADDRG